LTEKGMPSNLRGYTLEKEGGMGIIKKLILIIVVVLVLLYFFKRVWFDLIVNYVLNLF